jgi:hypothetical protein
MTYNVQSNCGAIVICICSLGARHTDRHTYLVKVMVYICNLTVIYTDLKAMFSLCLLLQDLLPVLINVHDSRIVDMTIK